MGSCFFISFFKGIVDKILYDLKLEKFMNFEGVCHLVRILLLLYIILEFLKSLHKCVMNSLSNLQSNRKNIL
jgi:hypothetical protein